MATRVIVASSRTLIRAGLIAILDGQPHIQVIDGIDDVTPRANLDCDVLLGDAGATAREHLANIYGKLHLRSRTEAVLWAAHNL